ncbi:MAG: hypothetical protein OHK006_24340 [Thermodesulfovibrionales bacterium]
MAVCRTKRVFERNACDTPLDFTVLPLQEEQRQSVRSAGRIIDCSQAGIGLVTDFPLQPGHVLQWEDRHRNGGLHLALVKWALQQEDRTRAGLQFI